MTIAQENAAARAKAGVRTITHEQLRALADSTPTAPKAANDTYSNPPDGYAIALSKLPPEAPTVAATVPTHHDRHGFKTSQKLNTVPAPDGYKIALDNLARQTSTPAPASSVSSVASDGYAIALTEQRKEKK